MSLNIRDLTKRLLVSTVLLVFMMPFGSATVSVLVSHSTVSIPLLGTQTFTARVMGTSNDGVVWLVNGIAGGNSSVGTIVASGEGTALYSAPASPPSPATVTVS